MSSLALRAAGGDAPPKRATELFGPAEMEMLRWIARGVAPRGTDPEDLLQDALVRALRNLDSFQSGTSLYAWMRTIMQRLAIDQLRAGARRPTELLREESCAAPEAPDEEPWWVDLAIDDVRAACDTLPEPMRETFQMYAFEGLSYEEIAGRMGVAPGTVGTRLLRSRRRLRGQLLAGCSRKWRPLEMGARAARLQGLSPGA